MKRQNMAPYLAERLIHFKKGYEGINQVYDLFLDIWGNPKVKINTKIDKKPFGSFEYEFDYNLIDNKKGILKLKISGLDEIARSRLENKFEKQYFPENIKKGNLIIRSVRTPKNTGKKGVYIFDTELVSIHDKNTFESFLEYFVNPFIRK